MVSSLPSRPPRQEVPRPKRYSNSFLSVTTALRALRYCVRSIEGVFEDSKGGDDGRCRDTPYLFLRKSTTSAIRPHRVRERGPCQEPLCARRRPAPSRTRR